MLFIPQTCLHPCLFKVCPVLHVKSERVPVTLSLISEELLGDSPRDCLDDTVSEVHFVVFLERISRVSARRLWYLRIVLVHIILNYRAEPVNYWMGRCRVELCGVCISPFEDISGVLDHRHLEPIAYCEDRLLVLSAVLHCGDHALGSTVAEASGDDNSSHVLEVLINVCLVQVLRLYELQLNRPLCLHGGCLERV